MKQSLVLYLLLINLLVTSCNNFYSKPVVHELEKGDYYISGDFKHDEGVAVIAQGSNVPSEMILSAAPYQSNYASEELTQIYKHKLTPLPNAYTEEKVLKIIKPGQDGRSRVENTKKWPYSFHSQLSLTFSGGEYSGSGLLVGPQHILTCAHNVYDHTNKQGWVQRIEVRPGLNGTSAPYGHALVKRIYAFQGWSSQGHTSYDMALLILDRSVGYKTGWCGLLAAPTKELKKSSVHITGYPGDKESNQLWTMNHTLKDVQAEELVYLIDTYPGQSGSGIWLNGSNDYFTSSVPGGPYAVGVHTQGSNSQNSGVRLSYSKAKQLVGWISETMKLKETITSFPSSSKSYSTSHSNTLSTNLNTFSSYLNNASLSPAIIDALAKEARNGNKDALMKLLNPGSSAYAKLVLGNLYAAGVGVVKDFQQALNFYQESAEQGNPDAQYKLGTIYNSDEEVIRDYAKSQYWYAKAAEGYKKAAEQGNVDAQYIMGRMCFYGQGVPKNHEKAAEWYEKAATKGHVKSQYKLGDLYFEGTTNNSFENLFYVGPKIPQNYKKAREFYEKAANQGHAKAQYKLGNILYHGQGITRDYEKAAQQGHADAQNQLGDMYFHGEGVEKNYSEAEEWYKKAADKGHSKAQLNLLGMIPYGYGNNGMRLVTKMKGLREDDEVENCIIS